MPIQIGTAKLHPLKKPVTIDRLFDMSMPEPNSGCWIWLGNTTGKSGYPRFNGVLAHRLSWELANGPIGPGLTIDHTCRIRLCINPAHGDDVTWLVNVKRGGNTVKTRCPRGHAYDGFTRVATRRSGFRFCKICYNAAKLRKYYIRMYGAIPAGMTFKDGR